MTTLYIGNDMEIRFTGTGKLVDETGEAVTGATVRSYIYQNGTDTQVGGVEWPVVMLEQSAGEYYGTIPDTAEIVEGVVYDMVITVDAGDANAEWRQPAIAKYRVFGR